MAWLLISCLSNITYVSNSYVLLIYATTSLHATDLAAVIVWMPHGRSWKILNRDVFDSFALLRYFGHSNHASFVRIINAWYVVSCYCWYIMMCTSCMKSYDMANHNMCMICAYYYLILHPSLCFTYLHIDNANSPILSMDILLYRRGFRRLPKGPDRDSYYHEVSRSLQFSLQFLFKLDHIYTSLTSFILLYCSISAIPSWQTSSSRAHEATPIKLS